MNRIKFALDIATAAHFGQFRKDGVTPYITHPVYVASKFPWSEDLQIVALLHDVLEDNPNYTEETIRPLGDRIVVAVKLLTRTSDMGYYAYIESVCENSLARAVKIQDILHNLSENPNPEKIDVKLDALRVLLHANT